jgi:hypothetical protein
MKEHWKSTLGACKIVLALSGVTTLEEDIGLLKKQVNDGTGVIQNFC